MNKQRRKDIDEVKAKIDAAKALLEEAAEMLENIKGDEEDYLYNMPDSLQESERSAKAKVKEIELARQALTEFTK